MQTTATISVRIDAQTRQILSEMAASQGATGASGLAREILTHWAVETLAARTRVDIEHAAAYLRSRPAGWADEPVEFFPGVSRSKKAR